MKVQLTLSPEDAAVVMKMYEEGEFTDIATNVSVEEEGWKYDGLTHEERNEFFDYLRQKCGLHTPTNTEADREKAADPPTPAVSSPLPHIMTRLLAAGAIALSAACFWVGWLSAPAAVLSLAALFAATRARAGYWLAGLAVVAATAGVTAWALKTPNKSYAAELDRATQAAGTTEVNFNGKGQFALVASAEERQRATANVKRVQAAYDRLLADPTDANEKAFMAALRESGPAGPEIENENYTIPEGEQRLVVRAGGQVLFDKRVTIPPGARIECAVTQPEPGRYQVVFAPPLR